MALYRVTIEGYGFEILASALRLDDESTVRGFVVVRLVEAPSEAEAIAAARARVAADWKTGKFSERGVRPQLRTAEVERLGFLGRLRASETGYIFHPDAG